MRAMKGMRSYKSASASGANSYNAHESERIIGKALQQVQPEPTLLQKETGKLVRTLALAGLSPLTSQAKLASAATSCSTLCQVQMDARRRIAAKVGTLARCATQQTLQLTQPNKIRLLRGTRVVLC